MAVDTMPILGDNKVCVFVFVCGMRGNKDFVFWLLAFSNATLSRIWIERKTDMARPFSPDFNYSDRERFVFTANICFVTLQIMFMYILSIYL